MALCSSAHAPRATNSSSNQQANLTVLTFHLKFLLSDEYSWARSRRRRRLRGRGRCRVVPTADLAQPSNA